MADWDRDGFLILRNFISIEAVEAVNNDVSLIIAGHTPYPDATIDVLAGSHEGKRFKAAEAPKDALNAPIKINDLFISSEAIRACNIGPHISDIIRELLDGDPLVCNSLNFIYGSTQQAHYDSWFMPPLVKDKMLATSICLEKVTEKNGPVFMYPGSHKIPPYRFPHGGIGKLSADLAPAVEYARETTKHISPVKFLGEPGDMLIWHGQLFHGGSTVEDWSMTRKSLVTHYFRAKDTAKLDAKEIGPGAYMMNRSHPHVH